VTRIRRTVLVSLISVLLLAGVIAPAGAAALSDLDAFQDIGGGRHCLTSGPDPLCHPGLALTAVILADGYVTDVALHVDRSGATTSALVVELHAGLPDGPLLAASDPVPASEIPISGSADWVSFTFAAPVWSDAGDTIALVVLPSADPADRWGIATGGDDWNMLTRQSGTWQSWPGGLGYAVYVQRSVARLAGGDRYATAAAVSEANYPVDVPLVYVATGLSFPDALAGAAAAGHAGAPLLLVPGRGTTVPPVVADELGALDPDKIIVLGGTGAVSGSILTKLHAYAPSVVRVSGPDRYATAVAISKATYPSGGVTKVFVATGGSFPDALAAAAVAGRDGAPLLLVPGGAASLAGVPTVVAELQRLAPDQIVIAGGPGAVSAGIEAHLQSLFGSTAVVRFSGPNRYATAAAISAASFPAGPTPTVYAATGLNFPDALAGAALASRDGAPLLLVPGTSPQLVYPAIETELVRLHAGQVVIFGGPGAVSNGIANTLAAHFVWP
jgi:putative cell wall-binding protein